MSPRPGRILSLVLALFAGAALLLGGTSSVSAGPPESNPLAGVKMFVDHDTPAWYQWQAYKSSGHKAKAALIWRIAREPRALWLGRFTRPNLDAKVRRRIDAARAQGAVPIFTVMRA